MHALFSLKAVHMLKSAFAFKTIEVLTQYQ